MRCSRACGAGTAEPLSPCASSCGVPLLWDAAIWPGIAASFNDAPHIPTFAFVVPAGGTGPVDTTIRTDRDRIEAWWFYDCSILQL